MTGDGAGPTVADDPDAAGAMSFVFEAGVLKRARRTGWWFTGVDDPESIAEHSFRVAVVGTVLAAMEGADPARVALLCVLHDTQESRTTDIPHIGRRYLASADAEAVTADQVAAAPEAVRRTVLDAVAEYEAGRTPEAVVARDADKLECLVQAVEYRHRGVGGVQRWIDSSLAALRTDAARRLAAAALDGDPLGWLGVFRGGPPPV